MEMNSQSQQEIHNLEDSNIVHLEKFRKKIKTADKIKDLPLDDSFFDKLHDKIMAGVEDTEMAPAPVLMMPRSILRRHWRGWLYPMGGLMTLLMVSSFLLGYAGKINQSMQRVGLLSDGRERIVAEALKASDELPNNLLSMQSEADFFVDVASESFETLPVANFNKIKGESVR